MLYSKYHQRRLKLHRDRHIVVYFCNLVIKNCLKKPRVLSKSEESGKQSVCPEGNENREMSTEISLFSPHHRENQLTLPAQERPSSHETQNHIFFSYSRAYCPFDSSLSEKDQFPSLYQLAREDDYLVHGMIRLLLHFDWTWVALVLSEDGEKEQFVLDLETEMVKDVY